MNQISLRESLKKGNWRGLFIYFGLLLLFLFLLYIPIAFFYPNAQNREEYDKLFENYSFRLAFQIVFLGAAILATYYMCKNYDKRDFKSLYLTISIKNTIIGFLIGAAIMFAFAFLTFSAGFVDFKFQGITLDFLWGFIFYLLVAATEEIIFRGYVLANLRDRYSSRNALIVSSVLFGLIHLGNDHLTVVGFATISLSGLLMGMVTIHTNTISTAIGLHWSWNFIQGNVLGLPVSGLNESGVYIPHRLATEIITGGDFGAEGSVVALTLVVLIILCINRFPFVFGLNNRS
jgi:membrane protease YdiL (CAAX protease family)